MPAEGIGSMKCAPITTVPTCTRISHPEGGGSMFLRNARTNLKSYMKKNLLLRNVKILIKTITFLQIMTLKLRLGRGHYGGGDIIYRKGST
jgi:hypothetical protein